MKVVKELEEVEVSAAIHPRRRMVVLLRDDGRFTFAEQYHYTIDGEPIAGGWATLSPGGIFATAADAEAEARAELSTWPR